MSAGAPSPPEAPEPASSSDGLFPGLEDGPAPAGGEREDGGGRPHHAGHRERLRARFLEAVRSDSLGAVADYELLELLLFLAIPQRDVKPLAKDLIARFGSLGAVLSADPDALMRVKGIKEGAVVALKTVQAGALALIRREVIDRPVLSSWDRLVDYCHASMAYRDTEQFRVLFLDRKNRLICDELQQRGTVDHTPVYPREVVKRALELQASALILVHNHPSGDPQPSASDIEMTRRIRDACAGVAIALHDHLVIGRAGFCSFKAEGLL